jgi:hypothetical protein
MEGSLEAKVIVVFRVVPEVVCTMAVKAKVPPTGRDVAVDGRRLMRPGNRGGPGWDPPPHPAMVNKE